ncbi:DUF4865 family protein [Rosenbergiella epipactidis]|uniref:DUF4865 family protein n=1 Tax=Rosenbergiella epipactidis TaxID=1544694 RepID=UPI000664537F|nr:DUF4865 family protein [Rosenbergiella epipactidis]KMV68278.1 hypothetical protein AI29_09470 [bacteria symbiont BFo2 of Frankliniella occidentalis]KYP95317.1 hypothetical protein WB67_06745 [bacteria symbiont BFo2 of Frankliniella occidentalis]
MIVMQYRFTLPADYDMDVIDRRIQENGAMLDGFPGLLLKAYLVSYKNEANCNENRYAPLYIWKSAEAMANFLQSPGFKKVAQDFGWPQIDTWLALRLPDLDEVRNAEGLSMRRQSIVAQSVLSALPQEGQLCAWDVSRWQLLQVNFGTASGEGQENYRIKYVASGV